MLQATRLRTLVYYSVQNMFFSTVVLLGGRQRGSIPDGRLYPGRLLGYLKARTLPNTPPRGWYLGVSHTHALDALLLVLLPGPFMGQDTQPNPRAGSRSFRKSHHGVGSGQVGSGEVGSGEVES